MTTDTKSAVSLLDAEAVKYNFERNQTIETREYSDGFGRVVQTRTQGEDVRFGDAWLGGGSRWHRVGGQRE